MAKETHSNGSSLKKKRRISKEQALTSKKVDLTVLDIPESLKLRLTENNGDPMLADAALSNFVVLRNIFSTLNSKDLESCCHVSQYWRAVADPMVVMHYDIQLGKEEFGHYDDDGDDAWVPDHVVIKESVRYDHKNFQEYESNFEGISRTLEEVLQTQKIIINLVIFGHIDTSHENVTEFMSKFGSFVQSLSFADEVSMTTNQFCKLLINNFPNLEKLNCSMIRLTREIDSSERQIFNIDLPENKLEHLKKIYFSSGVEFKTKSFVSILKIAPNLEEIRDFPIQLINSLLITQRANTLKSVTYPHNEPWLLDTNGETVVTAFEKLAQVRPKLESFRFAPSSLWPIDFLSLVKPHVYSVLHSSEESLKSLTMIPSEFFGFQDIPSLNSLKTIEFYVTGHNEEHYFPENISLGDIFPNVTEVSIFMNLTQNIANHYFPHNVFSPWGSQIQKLKIRSLSQGSIQLIQSLFPCLKEFIITASPGKLQEILPDLVQLWPDLESLVIDVDYSQSSRYSSPQRTLDSVFTGIPEDLICQLMEPSTREKFTAEEIQSFRDGSTIGKLTQLKVLKLILRNRFLTSDFTVSLPTLTQISNEFAFQLIPGLKVIVGIWKNHRFAEEIKTSLQPFVNHIIDIDGYFYENE